ncbi:FecCD family ABC transporter permease [Halomonas sp. H2]|uniref:FecCD family ABC transporter permease n=1 Tax=Halomonas sp. H2 TaxID=261936 RepID=UPI003CFB62E1
MDSLLLQNRVRALPIRALWLASACLFVLSLATAGALALGEFGIPFHVLLQALMRDDGSDAAFVIRELRMPRLLTGMLAGGALGLAGAIVQSVTRNPLGEPGLLGVTSGAAFAMALCMTYFTLSTPTMLLLSTVGGIVAALLTLSISLGARLNPLYLTLTGMSVNLFFAAAIIVLLICANVEANGIYYWLTGSLINRTWEHVHLLWPWVIPALLLAIVFAGKLDLLRMDDEILVAIGMRVTPWRLLFGVVAVLLAAATVAATGPITFIGLVSPHLVRFTLGANGVRHRHLLPLSALVGASLVCAADLIAKWHEVPVGILCVLLGGPVLVYLISRQEG